MSILGCSRFDVARLSEITLLLLALPGCAASSASSPPTPPAIAAASGTATPAPADACDAGGDRASDAAVEEDPRAVLEAALRACELGGARACAEASDAYSMGRGVTVSRGCHARFAQRACDLGNLPACASVAQLLTWGVLPADPERAAALNQKACGGGVLDACNSLARAYDTGAGVKKDPARAAQLYLQVCDQTSPSPDLVNPSAARACVPLAERLLSGLGLAKDPARAVRLYEAACSQGVRDACFQVAKVVSDGLGVPKDAARGARHYDSACNLGGFDACFELAKRLADGRGVPADPARAAELFETTCNNSFGAGCDEGSSRFRTGRGVVRDLDKAAALEDMGIAWSASHCRMQGDIASCDHVVASYTTKGVKPLDTEVAVKRLAVACEMGRAKACRVVAQKYREGRWAGADQARAATLEARARDLQDATRVKAMLERQCNAGSSADCYLLGDAYLNGKPAWRVPEDPARGQQLIRKACTSEHDLDIECRMVNSFADSALMGTEACDGEPSVKR